ncbi:MAG: O-antigen ligase family protein [Patescibacteria group bacterium]
MPNYLKRFSLTSLLVIFLAIFTIINPNIGLDILAFLIIIFIILQKIFGEYFILILLATRPALDYWRDIHLFSFPLFDFNINAALSVFLLIWSVYFFAKNHRYFKHIPAKIPWVLFIAWCSLTAIYSYDLTSTIRETIKATNLFGLFGICYIMSIKDEAKFKKDFLKALIAASVIPLLVGVYQFFTKTGLDIDGVANRIHGTFAHPNILATFALLLLMVLVNKSFLAKNKNLQNSGALPKLSGLFLLMIIALTYTRIAWIGVAVLFIIVGLVYYRKMLVYILASVVLFYGLFSPFNNYLINNYNINLQAINLISRLTARNEDSDSIKWRLAVATKVLPLFEKKPVLGYGYGSFPKVWDDNKDVGSIWDNTSEAHNDYIKVAFESGIIGLILFLSIFINLLYKQISFGVKNTQRRVSMDGTRHDFAKSNIVFIASIVIYLILSLSDNMLHHTPMIWWLWAVWGWWSAEYRSGVKELSS